MRTINQKQIYSRTLALLLTNRAPTIILFYFLGHIFFARGQACFSRLLLRLEGLNERWLHSKTISKLGKKSQPEKILLVICNSTFRQRLNVMNIP